jgi:DNA invertase Pin-like site-specific DNA recombinase
MQNIVVGYLRVSTSEQGKSGLGLEAQREAIERFAEVEGLQVAEWFTEIETGKGYNAMDRRPVLAAALRAAQKRRAALIVSKLDRLSRDVAFVAKLMAERVRFIALDAGKDAEPFILHVRAAMAQEERHRISVRTKDALAALKRRGVKLGNPNRRAMALAQRKGAQTNKEAADTFAHSTLPIIEAYQKQGYTLREIAEELNKRGIPTARGGRWHDKTLVRVMKRTGAHQG